MSLLSMLPFVLLDGYILCSAILLGGFALFTARRRSIRELLSIANSLLLIGATWVLFSSFGQVLQLITAGNESDKYLLLNRISGPYWYFYWGSIVCKGVLAQAFWFRRFRRSIGATIVLLICLLLDFYSALFLLTLRDYLPSSWSVQSNYLGLLISFGFFAAILLLVSWLTKWRKTATAYH